MRFEGRGRAGEDGADGSKAGSNIGLKSARFVGGMGSMSASEEGMGDCIVGIRSADVQD